MTRLRKKENTYTKRQRERRECGAFIYIDVGVFNLDDFFLCPLNILNDFLFWEKMSALHFNIHILSAPPPILQKNFLVFLIFPFQFSEFSNESSKIDIRLALSLS